MTRGAVVVVSAALLAAAAAGSPPSERLDGVERKIREAREDASEIQAQAQSVLAEVDQLDRQIEASEKKLEATASQVRAAEKERDDAAAAIAALDSEIETLRMRQRARVRGLDRLRRRGFGPILFQAPGDLAEALRFRRGMEAVLAADRELAERVRENRVASETARERAASAAQELGARRQESAREVAALRAARAEKRELVASIRAEGRKRTQLLEDLERSAQALRKLLETEEAARRSSEAAAKAPERGDFVSPLAGVRRATTARNGVEIRAQAGTPIRAVAAGRVVYADWFSGYGKMIIVDHGEHLYSVYGYASDLLATPGATVRAGETIGRVGATGTAVTSALYFEMRLRGAPKDPGAYIEALARR